LVGLDFLILAVFFLGCITKRAQVPFSAWLPAAMAAPTPVSSLVHSSTLVTAGVYVLVRYNFLFFFSKVVCVLSLGTLFVGGLGACLECDFKKIIAMSTLRQLGLMVYRISLGY
jgi:NADH-ubiquinone oxidoreductase chain 5